MKTLTDKEDFFIPIVFLFVCSVMLGRESSMLYENMQKVGSIILTTPAASILFSDNTFGTFNNVLKLLVPLALFIFALKQKSILLIITYILGTVPLILSDSVIIKIGYGNLFIIRIAVLFIVAILLIKYLLNVIESYKSKLEENTR